ncbi:MAG: hypothetical protein ACE5HY_05215 [Candidatus Hydrothermarchaeales archaeon]
MEQGLRISFAARGVSRISWACLASSKHINSLGSHCDKMADITPDRDDIRSTAYTNELGESEELLKEVKK